MSPASDLQALLRELRGVRSPVQRMKLLTLGWRTVRRLTPTERKELANQLGMKGLDGVLSRLGRGEDGITPTEMMQVLEKADDIDPSKMGQLFRDLRDPGRRKALIRRGLDALQEHLAEGEDEEETREDEVSPEKTTERVVTPEELRPPVVLPPPPSPEPVSDPTPPIVEAKPEPAPVVPVTEPEAEEAAPETEPAPVEPEPVASPRPVVVTPPPVVTPPTPVPEAPAAEVDVAGWVNRLSATTSLTARFRVLRSLVSEGTDLGLADLRSIAASFPDGWARRRVIERLLRAGHAADLDDALTLIEDLERPNDRRWCCAALVDSRDLTEEDAGRLSERFPFPFLVRRMRRTSRCHNLGLGTEHQDGLWH